MILAAATPADLAAIAALHRDSWAGAYRGMVPDAALGAPLDDHMARTWGVLPDGVTVAREGERLLGFVRLKVKDGWPYVDNLHVAPGLHGRGIGRALMGAVHAEIQAGDRHRLWLTVLRANGGARAFYRALGGVEGAAMHERLLGQWVTTCPVVWTRLGALERATGPDGVRTGGTGATARPASP